MICKSRYLIVVMAFGLILGIGCSRTEQGSLDSVAPSSDVAVADRMDVDEPGARAGTTGTNRTTAPIGADRLQDMSSVASTPTADDIPVDSDEPLTARRRGNVTRTDAAVPLISPLTADSPAGGSPADRRDRSEDQDDPDAPVLTPPAQDKPSERPKLNNGRDGAAKPGTPGPGKQTERDPADASGPAERPAAPAGAGDTAVDDERSEPDGTRDGTTDSGRPESGAGRPDSPAPSSRQEDGLPDKYRSRDKDGDGQLGLYEWPRDDLEAFRKLDRDQDGFLVPGELAEPEGP